MNSTARLVELKNRLELLKIEAESAASNARCIVTRGDLLVTFQKSIQDAENFLRSYPVARSELDVLVNSLVKLNCELEICLTARSELCDVVSSNESNNSPTFDNEIGRETCISCSKEKRNFGTNTDNVCVDTISELDRRENIINIYDISEGSILEMRHLQGDNPSQFYLGYYSDHELSSHLAGIKKKFDLGELHHIERTPAIGQFIIGRVDTMFRGCVLSVSCGKIVVVDIDTGEWKLLNEHDAWEIEDYLSRFPAQALFCKLWSFQDTTGWNKYLSSLFRNCLSKCNLVVTVKEIIPDVIPIFVVDVDAHTNALLDVNMTEWINAHIVPAIEKSKFFGLSDSVEQAMFQDLDPFEMYKESCSDSDSVISEQNQIYVQNVNVTSEDLENKQASSSVGKTNIDSKCDLESMQVGQSTGEIDIDSNCLVTDLEETPVRSSCELLYHIDCDRNEEFLSQSTKVTPMRNSCELLHRIDCDRREELLMADVSNDSFISAENSPESLMVKKEVLNSTEHIAKQDCEEQFSKLECEVLPKSSEQIPKSTAVKCFLEKNKTLQMSFFQGNDPWNFILNHVSQQDIEELKSRVDEKARTGALIPFSNVPEIGDFAIGKCDSEYCRVRITDISQQNKMDNIVVTDIDSGEIKLLSLKNLWVLEDVFSWPPAMAVNCTLWSIPRNPFYWNTDLETLFRKVMSKNRLSVCVKDVELISGNWKHFVQIQIFSDCVFDVREWIICFIFPNLGEIRQLSVNGHNFAEMLPKLDPAKVFTKLNVGNTSKGFLNSLCTSTGSGVANNSLVSKLPNTEHDTPISLQISQKGKKLASVDHKNKEICSKLNSKLPCNDILNFKKSSRVVQSGTKYYVFLSNIVSPSEFYIHAIMSENSCIDEMQKELSNYCSVGNLSFHNKREAKQLILQCCAVHYENQWCRGRIVDWFDDSSDNVLIFLVDYGIHTTVSFKSVQCLRSDFYRYPVFAQKCALAFILPPGDDNTWPQRSLKAFSSLLDYDTVYEILIVSCVEAEELLTVFLLCGEGKDVLCVNDYLVDEGYALPQICNGNVDKSEACHTVVYPITDSGIDEIVSESEFDDERCITENVDVIRYLDNNVAGLLCLGQEMSVVITEVINMSTFYAVPAETPYEGRLQKTHEVLMRMNNKIAAAVQRGILKTSKRLREGTVVIAHYSKDKNWYRARLLSPISDTGHVEVFFVDYGNIDQVHKDHIKEIRKEFCVVPFQAIRFFIDAIDVTQLSDKHAQMMALPLLKDLMGQCEVQVKVTREVMEDVVVKVLYEGRDVGTEMLELYHVIVESSK